VLSNIITCGSATQARFLLLEQPNSLSLLIKGLQTDENTGKLFSNEVSLIGFLEAIEKLL
jgi:hypothetical protein